MVTFPTNTGVDDPNIMMTHFSYSQGPLIIFILLLVLQTTELNYTNTIYEFANDYLKKRHLPLNARNERKLLLRSNMLRLILFKVTFIPVLILSIIAFIALTIQSYLYNDSHFTLISVFISNISLTLFFIQLLGLISLSLTICLFIVLYLRYKFREIKMSSFQKHFSFANHCRTQSDLQINP